MLFVYLIMFSMLAGDLWWWWLADRNAKKLGTGYRWMTGIFMGLTVLGLFLLILARLGKMRAMIMPELAVQIVFIWHFMVLPLFTIPSLLGKIVGGVRSLWKPRVLDPIPVDPDRRAFLAQIITLAPPVITAGLTVKTILEKDEIAIRRTDLGFRQLPKELEGTTIAFVADPHIGSFMSDSKYKRIIDLTNSLDADFVLHGGDLINASLGDLPDGIQMLKQFKSRRGVFSCQGNHDCIEDRRVFESANIRANTGMLLDEAVTLKINNRKLQIIAPRWIGRSNNSSDISVNNILPIWDRDAFAILLAHHPHCFDAAAAAQIPLTLAGHTHGGQIALSHNIGFGPIMYKYWSGEYRKNDTACLVSNGVGNWFPLRINMPCEIIQITLQRA